MDETCSRQEENKKCINVYSEMDIKQIGSEYM
jgi:hypothetical protein